MVRLAAAGVCDRAEVADIRAHILPMAQQLSTGLHETVAAVASQSSLAQDLLAKGICGPEYLERIAQEREEPLLLLSGRAA